MRTRFFAAFILSALGFASIARAAPTITTLLDFGGAIGNHPNTGLVADAAGNLYGVTQDGGRYGRGVVFELSPPAPGGTGWTSAVLYELSVAYEASGLTLDPSGALYVSTIWGGTHQNGAILKLMPAAPGAAWVAKIVHEFRGGLDGGQPGPVTIGSDGTLYGAATAGGGSSCPARFQDFCGNVFALTPSGAGWNMRVLHHFQGSQGITPKGPLALGPGGELYGTAVGDGRLVMSSVVKLVPPPAHQTHWAFSTIYTFSHLADGTSPGAAGLRLGADGYLYGGTAYGGPRPSGHGAFHTGSIYRLLPPPAGQTHWRKENLYSAPSFNNGGLSYPVVFDASGRLYATAYNNGGDIIKLTPPAPGHTTWPVTTLETGDYPIGPVVVDASGTVYALTYLGGLYQAGAFISITP